MIFQRWIFEIPLLDIQADEFVEGGGDYQCVCCGKGIKSPKFWVHLLVNGRLVSTPEEFDESEDQGFYPIGANCKNKLPNNFYFTAQEAGIM